MKHSERGSLLQAHNVKVGHTIQWCDRSCRVIARRYVSPRGIKRWVYLTVEVPDIGIRELAYENAERVHVTDFTDPRLAAGYSKETYTP